MLLNLRPILHRWSSDRASLNLPDGFFLFSKHLWLIVMKFAMSAYNQTLDKIAWSWQLCSGSLLGPITAACSKALDCGLLLFVGTIIEVLRSCKGCTQNFCVLLCYCSIVWPALFPATSLVNKTQLALKGLQICHHLGTACLDFRPDVPAAVCALVSVCCVIFFMCFGQSFTFQTLNFPVVKYT